jgi:D-beta-D-heptose 7-phosphate kinase/D-beta-D-heptose 1-phosphate adenosyltransferase
MIKILVVGEKCTDKFIYCKTNRLSPEAPVPVVIPIKEITNPGMSGNIVENLNSLNNNLNIKHWSQEKHILKTRFIEEKSNHMFLRVDEGENEVDKILIFQEEYNSISDFDIVIVSDYNKGFLSENDLIEIGKRAKLSILDSKKKLSEETIKSYSFIKMNEIESEYNLSTRNFPNVITTYGADGCKFRGEVYPSMTPKETIDVSGAGDTFTSSFILEYFKTKNIKESLIYANEMAGVVVSKRGVTTPN